MSSTISTIYDSILAEIDEEIVRLMEARNRIIAKQARAVEINAMRERGEMICNLLTRASSLRNSYDVLLYINAYIMPWRHYLIQKYFPKTLAALPESLPSKWNDMEVSIFFLEVSGALEQDRAVLASLQV
jgi:hypothetical protein